MKPKETLEALLKRYYQNQRRAIQPDEAFDQMVLERALAKQAERGNSSGKPVWRLVLAGAASAAILAAAFVILERNVPKAEPAAQKEIVRKLIFPEAACQAGLPTLFQVNLVLREEGLDEACKRMTYAPKNTEQGTTLRSSRAMRLDTVSNGS